MKRNASFTLETGIVDMFRINCAIKHESMSSVIEGLIRDWNIKNKAELNQAILKNNYETR